MSKAYLLPCSACGTKTPVEAGRAGQLVRCTCGASVEVPTLRGLSQLEPAEIPGAGRKAGAWGLRQRLYFLGLLVFLAGIAGGAFVVFQMYRFDRAVEQYHAAESFDKLTPVQSWHAWQHLRTGVAQGNPIEQGFISYRASMVNWVYAAIGAIAVGLLIAGSGLLVPPSRPAGGG